MSLAIWEILSYAVIPLSWYLFRRLARRDIAGEILAGSLLGLYIEFACEPLWNYHFAVTFYKDIPPSIPLAYGFMLSLVAFLSEKLCAWVFPKAGPALSGRRLVLFDVAVGILVGLPLETLGNRMGVWDYNYQVLHWTWGRIPVFQMPYEVLAGYAMLMAFGPSLVRHWLREAVAAPEELSSAWNQL